MFSLDSTQLTVPLTGAWSQPVTQSCQKNNNKGSQKLLENATLVQ